MKTEAEAIDWSDPKVGAWLRNLVGPWVPHCPTPKQVRALKLIDRPEILYGGAAGGGKSDWLLMEALRYAWVPGYSAIIFRRTFPQLTQSDGLIPRSLEWLGGTSAQWNQATHTWTFPSGATLTFGHMQHENAKTNYQGGAWQMIGFDELTHFTESQYLYLFSRRRRPKGTNEKSLLAQVPLRTRTASNPGGIGHDWVRQRFLVENDPKRAFIPAFLQDNPHLDQESYIESLAELDDYEREQLLSGNWDAAPPGSMFRRQWFPRIDRREDDATHYVRGWDLASTAPKPGTDPDYTVGVLLSDNGLSEPVIEDVIRGRWDPSDLDKVMLAAAANDPDGTEIWVEREGGASGKIAESHFIKLLAGYYVQFESPTGAKPIRARPVASWAKSQTLPMVRAAWNDPYLRELEMFVGDGTEAHDDQVDATSLAFSKLILQSRGEWGDLYPDPVDDDEPEEVDANESLW
jgi:predicted phage terminase large subunit-like protein